MTQPPTGPPTRGGPTQSDPALGALKAWRDDGLRQNFAGFEGIKDVYLKSVAQLGEQTPEKIATRLPSGLQTFASEMARVLSEAGNGNFIAAQPATPSFPEPAAPFPEPVEGPAGSPSFDAGGPPPATQTEVQAGEPVAPFSESGAAPTNLDHDDLAALASEFVYYDFSPQEREPKSLRVSLSPSGAQLSWDPLEASGITLYRVVSGEDEAPYAPERADILDITTEPISTDLREFGSAVRFYQVWASNGPSERAAKQAQPILHAELALVSPVNDLDLREDEGRVIGQWTVWPGIDRVQVFRIPVELARRAGRTDPQYRILSGDSNLGGFVDTTALRGKKYVYWIFTEARVEGIAQLSDHPRHADVAVSAVLAPVVDLEVRQHGDDNAPQFDLAWSAPLGGRVIVYRTEHGPLAGADQETHAEAALPQMKLAEESRLAHPVVAESEHRMGMRDVPWPRTWDRAYFTPVTVLDGQARVGTTVPSLRVGQVSDPVIVERCNQQMLKFGWPAGATSVEVIIGPKGRELGDLAGRKPQEITAAEYQRLGGMQGNFPWQGCAVHLIGVAFVSGRPVRGEPRSLEYQGLLRLHYATQLKRTLLGKPDAIRLRLRANSELDSKQCPYFVLVHHPTRLPLHVEDGEALQVTLDVDDVSLPTQRFRPQQLTQAWSEVAWKAEVRGRSGFVRLFVDLPPERLGFVALLDPAVDGLRLR